MVSTYLSTELREQGFARDHVEAALAHKVGGVEGVYNKAIYVEPRKSNDTKMG